MGDGITRSGSEDGDPLECYAPEHIGGRSPGGEGRGDMVLRQPHPTTGYHEGGEREEGFEDQGMVLLRPTNALPSIHEAGATAVAKRAFRGRDRWWLEVDRWEGYMVGCSD